MTNSRRRFLANTLKTGLGTLIAPAAVSIAADAASPASKSAPIRRPNILLLFPDQWRFDWMSGTTGLPIRTPNLDRLAKNGIRLMNNIVASPLCAPSRACLASGRVYDRCGVPSNGADFPYASIPTFYGMLRKSGYQVLACGKMDLAKHSDFWGVDGKWHVTDWGFSDAINNAGKFDQLSGYKKAGDKPADPYLIFLQKEGTIQEHLADFRIRSQKGYKATFPTPLPDDQYCDNWLSGNGLSLLNAAPKGKPWFLQVNWTGPHNPEDITKRMEGTVRGRSMPPVNGIDKYDDPTNLAIRQNYTAMCENIDREIGTYLNWLEKTGQVENTLIVFSSDHGEMLGDHGRWGKTVPYHPSACVPLIVSGPGVQKGVVSDALTSHIDLTATSLDYAGLSIPSTMDGKSLRPLLEGQTSKHRDVVFSALGKWRMVYDGRYKAVINFNAEANEGQAHGSGHGKENGEESTGDDGNGKNAGARGLPSIVWDRSIDPEEKNNMAASAPEPAKRLLGMLKEA
jgi:choline-sulfatase